MKYSEILSRAWKIGWKYKVLWVFGLFIGGGGISCNTNYHFPVPSQAERIPLPPNLQHSIQSINHILNNIPQGTIILFVLAITVILLFLLLLFMILRSIGKIGIIRGTLDANDEAETLGFKALLKSTFPFFLRLYFLNLAILIVSLAINSTMIIPVVLYGVLQSGIGVLCLIPFILIHSLFAFPLRIFIEQTSIALVVEDLDIVKSIERGWNVFKEHFWNLLILGIILAAIPFAVGLILLLPIFVMLAPAVMVVFTYLSGAAANSTIPIGFFIVAVILLLICLVIQWLLNAILATFVESAWTLAFLEITPAHQIDEESEDPEASSLPDAS